MPIPKDILGLAGEFAVASELCKRGIYAQLTLANRKRTDLLIDTDETMLRVQVKSKQGRSWPAIKGISDRDSVLVFVDFENKSPETRPDFYILTSRDWKSLVDKLLIKTGLVRKGKVSLSSDLVPTWDDGYIGENVRPSDVAAYHESWEKIARRLTPRSTRTPRKRRPG